GWRRLPPTGVIQVIAREWRTPVFQHAYEPPLFDMRCELFFGKKSDAQTFKRGKHDMRGAVEDHLTLNANIRLVVPAFELPDVQPAMGRKTQVDAVVIGQVVWFFRYRMVGEVGR